MLPAGAELWRTVVVAVAVDMPGRAVGTAAVVISGVLAAATDDGVVSHAGDGDAPQRRREQGRHRDQDGQSSPSDRHATAA